MIKTDIDTEQSFRMDYVILKSFGVRPKDKRCLLLFDFQEVSVKPVSYTNVLPLNRMTVVSREQTFLDHGLCHRNLLPGRPKLLVVLSDFYLQARRIPQRLTYI